MNFTIPLIIAGSITFMLALLLSHSARQIGNIAIFRDYPDNVRKLHKRPVPSTGGLALVGATMIGSALVIPFMMEMLSPGMTGFIYFFMAGAGLVAISGVYDDLYGLSFKPKFLMQVTAAIIVLYGLETQFVAGHISYSEVSWGVRAVIYGVLALWIVAGCNTINLVDGIDALAGSLLLTVIFGITIISVSWGVVDVFPFIIPLAAGVLGFLWFNRPPASLFMGDSGSMFSGFVIATSIIVLAIHASHWMYTLSLALLLSVPLTDTIFAIIRRVKFNVNPFESDHDHLHHILQRYFKGPGLAVLTLSSASVIMVTIAVLLSSITRPVMFYSVYGILFGLFLIIALIYAIRVENCRSVLSAQDLADSDPNYQDPVGELKNLRKHDNDDKNVRVSRLAGSHSRNGNT